MNKPINDQTLERLLLDYGQIPPPAPFQYRPRPALPAKFTKRLAAWSVAALLALLCTGLSVGILSGFFGGKPSVTDSSPVDPDAIVKNTTIASPTSPPPGTEPRPPVTPEVTDPPAPPVTNPPDPPKPPVTNPPDPPKPPVTNPNLPSLLPSWYKSPSIRLVNCIPSASQSSFQPVTLKEIYNDYAALDLDMGNYRYSFVSGDLILMYDHPASHQESFCKVVYLRPSDGELICLGHELKELWASAGVSYSGDQTLYNLNASKDGNRYVVAIQTQPGEGAVLVYDRKAQTLKKVPFTQAQFDAMDFLSYSDDCNYMVAALIREEDDLLDDLVLVDLNTMEITPICAGYNTFGHSKFSSDGRFVYTHLRIEDAVEQNEYGQWVLYDTQTGFTFKGKGEVLYLDGGILISRTPEGFTAYDCTTGKKPADLSSLPLLVDADYHTYYYSLTIYNPVTDRIVKTINVGTYQICGNYLYYYVHKSDSLVIADLVSGESMNVPVSEALLKGANPGNAFTHYSLAVSSDGSTISLGFTISRADYFDQTRDMLDALKNDVAETVLKTNNIPDFWKKFDELRQNYFLVIEEIGYELHEDYAILEIVAIDFPGREDLYIYQIVEDYRSDTFTLYTLSFHHPSQAYVPGGLFCRTVQEREQQTFRRNLKGDYEKTCALLPTLGERIPYYVDYQLCYDENGKWNNTLAKYAGWTEGYIQTLLAKAEPEMTEEGWKQVLPIILKYPLIEGISIEHLTFRRVGYLHLRDADNDIFYRAEIVVAADGRYYLRRSDRSHEITYEEFVTLMEAQNTPIAIYGLYKDPQIAYLPHPQSFVDSDYLIQCIMPTYYMKAKDVCTALAMIREGGHTNEEIKTVLFPQEVMPYIDLLAESIPVYQCQFSAWESPQITIHIYYGEISFSDPNPEIPLPASAQ